MILEKENKTPEKTPKQVPKFTAKQLAASKKFSGCSDLILALLKPEKTYSVSDTEKLVEGYRKGKVK